MDPTLTLALRSLHLLAVILWIGGAIVGGLVVAFATEEASGWCPAGGAARHPASDHAGDGGRVARGSRGSASTDGVRSTPAPAGCTARVTVALVASGLTGVLVGRLRKGETNAARGSNRGRFAGLAVGLGLCALLVVSLAKFRFGT